jgi:diguanylate cyclase (GGDEF)-like protein/PAS domain S-box-containing protein
MGRYAEFYQFAPLGYFTLAQDGAISEVNLAAASLIGLDRSKMLGRPFTNFVTVEHRPDFNAFLARVFESKSRQECDTELQKRIGSIPIHVHINANSVESGNECHLVVFDISERVVMQRALREKEHLLSESQRLARIGSWSMEIDKNNVRWTDETYRIYGVTPETFVPTKENLISLIYSKDQPAMREWIRACLAGEQPDELEFRVRRQDGNMRIIRSNGDLQHAPDGTPLRIIGTVQDITENKRVEDALREQEEFFRMIAESVDDFIAVLDLEGRRLYNNASYSRVFGNTESMRGSDSFAEIHPDDRERIRRIFKETIKSGVGQRAEFRIMMKDGSIHHMESSGGLIKNSQGEPLYMVVVSHDITARKMNEEEIHSLAFYDELTKLPNRRLLNDRLIKAMAASKRNGRYGALIFLDIDNFKSLNDAHGHDVGDMLLMDVARRIAACLREIDTVARFGGDEFVVVLGELNSDKDESIKQASIVAEKIRASLGAPYQLKISREGMAETTIEYSCTSSIGVMMFLNHKIDHKDIFTYADIAMYKAKDAGRNQVHFFETES